MAYTPTYTKPYPDGWKNLPEETTPITAEVLNNYDGALESIMEQLKKTTEAFDEDGEINLPNFSVDKDGNGNFQGDLIVKGTSIAGQSVVVFDSHDAMQTALNSAEKTEYKSGQTIRIRDYDQSDLWITGVNENTQEYVYDGNLEGDIEHGQGTVQIGYYSISIVKSKKNASSSDEVWYPSVSDVGVISWSKSSSVEPPEEKNIMGAEGKSAYQTALDNGFVGTEAEWIASLKGEPGGAYSEEDKAELMDYIDTKFTELMGDILGGAS